MPVDVKICGITRANAMAAALDAGADYVGLVFYRPSPRNLELDTARELADQARGRSKIVALTVDADDQLIDEIGRQIKPDFIQLHGLETPERIAEVAARSGAKTIKAVKVRTRCDVAGADQFAKCGSMILFDAKAPDDLQGALPGGNGLCFDWRLLQGIPPKPAYMLSGGLDADNVVEAIQQTKAPIVDVSSGVESHPGAKDVTAIRKFIEAAKQAV